MAEYTYKNIIIGLILVAVIGLLQIILGLKELWDDLKCYMKDRNMNK